MIIDDYGNNENQSGGNIFREWQGAMQIRLAIAVLHRILVRLNVAVFEQQKAETAVAAKDLLAAIRRFSQLIPDQAFSEATAMIGDLIIALTATDESAKISALLEVEKWHAAGKPAYIKNMPRFKTLVFFRHKTG